MVVFTACAVSALVVFLGTKKGPPAEKGELVPWRELVLSGVREGVANPRIALSYAAAFVARSDLVILGTFSVLWGATAAVEQGIEAFGNHPSLIEEWHHEDPLQRGVVLECLSDCLGPVVSDIVHCRGVERRST